MFYVSWVWDIVFGAILAVSLVLLIMSSIARKRNRFDLEDTKEAQAASPFTVVFYFQEDDIPQTESMLYADDCFELIHKSDEFEEVVKSSLPANSDELVTCYVPGVETESSVKNSKDLEDTDPDEYFRKDDESYDPVDRAALREAAKEQELTASNLWDINRPWNPEVKTMPSRFTEDGRAVVSEATSASAATPAHDDGLDDMARRLRPRKEFDEPDKIYDLPTATKPLWEQNNNDDFSDMNDLM